MQVMPERRCACSGLLGSGLLGEGLFVDGELEELQEFLAAFGVDQVAELLEQLAVKCGCVGKHDAA